MKFPFSIGNHHKVSESHFAVLMALCTWFGGARIQCASAEPILLDFNNGAESNAVGVIGIAAFSNAVYATPGSPAAGFMRTGGSDDTIASGAPSPFITDPRPISGANPTGITVRFATLVSSISFDLLDFDWEPGNFNEVFTVTLTDASGNVFATTNEASQVFPTAPYGDGSVLPLSFAAENIVQFHVLNKVKASGGRAGFGVDNLQFTPTPFLLTPANGENGESIQLSWGAQLTNLVLQTTPLLTQPDWMDLLDAAPVLDGSNLVVTVPATNAAGFFRLRVP